MVIAGLMLLGIFAASAKYLGSPAWTLQQAIRTFIPVWLVISIGNLLVGMISAGIPFLTEVAVLVAVFGLPALAAWAVTRYVV
jgi:hypothetical protein